MVITYFGNINNYTVITYFNIIVTWPSPLPPLPLYNNNNKIIGTICTVYIILTITNYNIYSLVHLYLVRLNHQANNQYNYFR